MASHGFSSAANWLVPGHVLLGANPTKGRGACMTRMRPIRCDALCDCFVSLQAEVPPMDSPLPFPESYAADAREAKPEPAPAFITFPIDDLQPASSLQYLATIVEELATRVRNREVLYIHCFAGRGRTGLVAACLLGELYEGVTADEALERVAAYYRLRAGFGVAASRAADGMSPETEAQRQQVRDFFAARATWMQECSS